MPRLSSVREIRVRAAAAFDGLEQVLASATIDEKREVLRKYVRAVQVDPDRKTVRISLHTALFNQMVAGGGFTAVKESREIVATYERRKRQGYCG
jgi:hypothetical protein